MSSRKIWGGGNGSPKWSPVGPSVTRREGWGSDTLLGLHPETTRGSEWGVELGWFPWWVWLWERVRCSLSIPSHCSIQLEFGRNGSLWEGKKRWRKGSVFLQRTLLPVAWLSGGRVAFPGYLAHYLPCHRCGMFVPWSSFPTEIITHIQSALHIHGFCTHRVSQPDGKYLGESSGKFQKTILKFAPHQQLFYFVFTTLYVAFTLY